MLIPFFPPDLFEEDRAALLEIVRDVATAPAQRFILGEWCARLEHALGEALGGAHVVACSSGTSALSLVLAALELGPGDEVVVPAFGCAPLASTVVLAGATPVFADVDARTLVVDPDAAQRAIGPRTRALMPAHVFSTMADMPAFVALAERHGLRLVEDSAVAQGAVLDGRPAGLWGEAGVFSFVQVKTFGTAGEGGVVVTRDDDIATAARMLRNHGQDGRERFLHHRIGTNSRFDEILAAFQLHRLPGLPARLERRTQIAARYTERFAGLAEHGVLAPPPGRNGRCQYVYSLLADDRDELRRRLHERGVASHVYYPRPLPRQPAFAPYAPPGASWPNAERASRRTLSIPIYPHLTDEQVEHVADAVCDAVESMTREALVEH